MPAPKEPRAAVFDFYGTLARASRWGPLLEEVLSALGLKTDPRAIELWNRSAAGGTEHVEASASREAYVAWEVARLRQLAEGCGAGDPGSPSPTQVARHLYSALKEFELEPYPDAADALSALSAARVPVAVCSNWDWDLDLALEATGLAPYVDVAVTSARAGARKPHHRIYQATLDGLGVAASETLFVGDDWGSDVEGPRQLGMEAVHLVRDVVGSEAWRPCQGQAPRHPGADGTHVRDLRAVLVSFGLATEPGATP